METPEKYQFGLTAEEIKKVDEWMKQQKAKSHTPTAIGGRYSFEFTPTGIGVFIKIKDFETGEELDVTKDTDW